MLKRLKKSVKKNKILSNLAYNLNTKFTALLTKISPVLASKYIYRVIAEKNLNLDNPQDFHQKLQWLKLYWQHPLVVKCADKYEVREYIKVCGCEEILKELYGVYDRVDEIDWEKLPEKFVIKTTNGCGTNIFCENKSSLNKQEVIRQLKKWLKTDFGLFYAETHYSKMKPRIICEKYLQTDSGLPNDYKFYCFHGVPKVILIIADRDTDLKLFFLDSNWNKLDIGDPSFKAKFNVGEVPPQPECLKEMMKYAEILSAPFPFVRVDMYEYEGKPVFGELTFTPGGAVARYINETGLKLMGDMLKLPEKYGV